MGGWAWLAVVFVGGVVAGSLTDGVLRALSWSPAAAYGPSQWVQWGTILVALFVLPWALPLLRALLRLVRRRPSSRTIMGSAHWAGPRQLAVLRDAPASGLLVGREAGRRGRLLRYAGPAHLLTIAPTRAGKGVGAILPNLLTADRSILCIDPKGENARITARARRRFGRVIVLDPFAVSGELGHGYDPLCGLEPDSPDLAEDAATLAEALVHDPPDQAGEAHWNEEAKALIAGLLLHIVTSALPEERRLVRLRELLTLPPAGFAALLATMQASPAAHGLVARAANRHLGKAEREAAGVLSSAQRHTHMLDSQRLVAGMARSEFRWRDLCTGTVTVFLVLPPDRLDTYARWLRLLVSQAIQELARAATASPGPGTAAGAAEPSVLFLLDEFAALGRLEPVERAVGLMAGLGLQLWPILQDLHQLRGTYGKRADSFLSNAGLIQVFGVNDIDTAGWLSRTLGKQHGALRDRRHVVGP